MIQLLSSATLQDLTTSRPRSHPHVNGRLATAAAPHAVESRTKQQLTRIRCVCGASVDRGRMIQCQARTQRSPRSPSRRAQLRVAQSVSCCSLNDEIWC
jgi:hypothetical protein